MTPRTRRRLLTAALLLNLAILALMAYDYFVRVLPLLVPWVVALSLGILAIAFADLLADPVEPGEGEANP